MAEFIALGAEVTAGKAGVARLAGDALDDLDAGRFKLGNLIGIIRKQADAPNAELAKNARREHVIAQISGEAEPAIRLDGVEALVLKLVGANLVHQADAAALLGQIEEQAGARAANLAERQFELRTAIAANRAENVAGETLGMDANQRDGAIREMAARENERAFAGACVLDAEDGETTVAGGQLGPGNDADRRASGFLARGHLKIDIIAATEGPLRRAGGR